MSEYKTLDLWFPEGRGDGRKFIQKSSSFIFEPIVKAGVFGSFDEKKWYIVDQHGYLDSYSNEEIVGVKFKEYHPPKKKVTKYLWVDTANEKIRPHFYKDMSELLKHSVGSDYGSQIYIRLDWSATEFDDE